MGVFPPKPATTSMNVVTNGSTPTPAKDIPNAQAKLNLPSQRGKDAVLFAAVGSDPMGVNSSLEL